MAEPSFGHSENSPHDAFGKVNLPVSPLRDMMSEFRSLSRGKDDAAPLVAAARRLYSGHEALTPNEIAEDSLRFIKAVGMRPSPALIHGLIELAGTLGDVEGGRPAAEALLVFCERQARIIKEPCLQSTALFELADTYVESGREAAAIEACLKGFEILRDYFVPAPQAELAAHTTLLRAYVGLNILDEAQDRVREIQRILRRSPEGSQHFGVVLKAKAAIAEFHQTLSDNDRALADYHEIVSAIDRFELPYPHEKAQCLLNIGEIKHGVGCYTEAAGYFKNALEILEVCPDGADDLVSEICLSYADTLSALGRFEEAETYRNMAEL